MVCKSRCCMMCAFTYISATVREKKIDSRFCEACDGHGVTWGRRRQTSLTSHLNFGRWCLCGFSTGFSRIFCLRAEGEDLPVWRRSCSTSLSQIPSSKILIRKLLDLEDSHFGHNCINRFSSYSWEPPIVLFVPWLLGNVDQRRSTLSVKFQDSLWLSIQ